MQHQLVVKRLGRQDYEPVWKAMHEFTDQRTEETRDEVWLVNITQYLRKDRQVKLST